MLLTAHWNDCRVPIHMDDAGLRDMVERFLGIEFARAEGASDEPPAITVLRDENGWLFESQFGRYRFERENDAAFYLFELLGHAFGSAVRWPVIHAGAFVVDGGAIVYPGHLRQGKSRMSFAAFSAEHPVLGDDRIALLPGEAAVMALPKCLKLRIEDDGVPRAWADRVPPEFTFSGSVGDDRRWLLSRRLPGMVDCETRVPLRAVAMLRRVDSGPTHMDHIPLLDALQEMNPFTSFGEYTPMDVLRFLKPHAPGGRIRRLNVAPGDIERGVDLLAEL